VIFLYLTPDSNNVISGREQMFTHLNTLVTLAWLISRISIVDSAVFMQQHAVPKQLIRVSDPHQAEIQGSRTVLIPRDNDTRPVKTDPSAVWLGSYWMYTRPQGIIEIRLRPFRGITILNLPFWYKQDIRRIHIECVLGIQIRIEKKEKKWYEKQFFHFQAVSHFLTSAFSAE
jgi:hypothetical protein